MAIIFRQNCEKNLFFKVIMSLTEFCSIGAEFSDAHNYYEKYFFHNFVGK